LPYFLLILYYYILIKYVYYIITYPPKPKIKYVPPNTHPWKLASFKKFVEKEKLKTLNEIDKLFG